MNFDSLLQKPEQREEIVEGERLSRLQHVLAELYWSREHAAAILAGFVPNTSAAFFGDLLPGHGNWKGVREEDIEMVVSETINKNLSLLSGDAKPPTEWIKQALERGIPILWLVAARANEKCRSLLLGSIDIQDTESSTLLQHEAKIISKHQSNARKKGHENSKKGQIVQKVIHVHYPNFLLECKKDASGDPLHGQKAIFAKQMADKYGLEESSIYRAIKRLSSSH